MASSSSSIPQAVDTDPLPLIPCPRCGRQVLTDISSGGKRPGNRYYKCILRSSGQCPFFEWQESYRAVLEAVRARALLAPPSPPSTGLLHRTLRQELGTQPAPCAPQVCAPATPSAPSGDLSRVAIMLSATNLMVTVIMLGICVLILAIVYFK
ncbi:uncharacterized protein LOC119276842 isoform X1 [Triticum dicoccoides]|uniref:uncharacterized protein LOC119276842 isoform X1 n=1 Tax=Triticum dicoccoides TaxID=85692 RepID=UPI00188F03A9|nr:uncharacterized protein LOC119276842 isoform X1 [Triticum dicoccoides]